MLAVETPRRYADFEKRCQELATRNPKICTLIGASHPTNEGRIVQILKISTGGGEKPEAVIVGGVHARELAPPDSVLSLVEELVEKYEKKAPITYPNLQVTDLNGNAYVLPPKTIEFNQFRPLIERLDIYFVPLVNPDGREFDIANLARWVTPKSGWRKNRRKRPEAPAVETPIEWDNGVDINRNFPIVWDFDAYYNMGDYHSAYKGDPAGKNWSEETFRGPSVESEPEAKNVKELVDALKNLRFYVDVHSYGPTVLHDWGIEDNGEDPTMSFLNPAQKEKADGLPPAVASPSGNPKYSEFVPEGEFGFRTNLKHLADVMASAINAQGDPGTKEEFRYIPQSSADLYRPNNGPTSGATDDYTFSTQVVWDTAANKAKAGPRAPIYAYTMEAGNAAEGDFHPLYKSVTADPTRRAFPKIEREIHFGLLAGLGWIAGRYAPAAEPPAPPPNPSSSSCCLSTVVLAIAALVPLLGGAAFALSALVGVL